MKPKSFLKRTGLFLMVFIFALAMPLTAFAAVDTSATFTVESDSWENYPAAPDISAAAGILVDAETGAILYDKGMKAERYPASITKVMTALVVLQNCPDLNAQVTMTETGLADAYEGSSNVVPTLGEVFTVDQCLQMLIVKSANDIASQLAEFVSGSVEAFAELMNQTAANLGCENTHFTNANGLENPDHYTSAYDMSIIMREALKYDRFREIIGMQGISIDATNTSEPRYYLTHVEMIVPESEYYYEGCLGGKTGYTDISACTLVAAAERNGMTLVGVVLGSQGTEQSFLDMAALFNYGFDNFFRAEGTWGYEVISGGVITIPNTIEDLSILSFEGTPSEEGVSVSIQEEGRQIGTALMNESVYNELMTEVEERERIKAGITATPEPEVTEAEAPAVEQKAETDETKTEEEKEAEMFPETSRKDNTSTGRIFLYVAIAILSLLIVIGILMIINSSRRNRRRRRK